MGKTILLADDSITIQKVIELTFSDQDFNVVAVGNGRLALEKAQEVRPDILLCDILMPEKDGYEVCEQFKKTPNLAHVPVLLLTGAFEPFDQERALRAGCDGFLAKPFEPETLIARVKELLSRAAARPVAPAWQPPAPEPPAAAPLRGVVPPGTMPGLPRITEPTTAPPPRAQREPSAPAPEPIPFPRAGAPPRRPPAPEPSSAPAAPATSGAPPGLPAREPGEAAVQFIPEEPFDGLDSAHFEAEERPATAAPDELLPMTAEESESLASVDTTSTVMFKPDQADWTKPPGSLGPPPAALASPPVEAPPSEPPVFEEVLDEDEIAYERTPPQPAPPAPAAKAPPEKARFEPPPAAPLTAPLPSMARSYPPSAPQPVAPVMPEAKAAAHEPPAGGAVAEAGVTAARPSSEEPPSEVASFADIGAAAVEPEPVSRSEAAEVSVPVDMVEKIAQRVVAQVSEKVVREIAWEVIPDLAEALIKQEIERLKDELQRIG